MHPAVVDRRLLRAILPTAVVFVPGDAFVLWQIRLHQIIEVALISNMLATGAVGETKLIVLFARNG